MISLRLLPPRLSAPTFKFVSMNGVTRSFQIQISWFCGYVVVNVILILVGSSWFIHVVYLNIFCNYFWTFCDCCISLSQFLVILHHFVVDLWIFCVFLFRFWVFFCVFVDCYVFRVILSLFSVCVFHQHLLFVVVLCLCSNRVCSSASRVSEQSASSEEELPQRQLPPQDRKVGAGECLWVAPLNASRWRWNSRISRMNQPGGKKKTKHVNLHRNYRVLSATAWGDYFPARWRERHEHHSASWEPRKNLFVPKSKQNTKCVCVLHHDTTVSAEPIHEPILSSHWSAAVCQCVFAPCELCIDLCVWLCPGSGADWPEALRHSAADAPVQTASWSGWDGGLHR